MDTPSAAPAAARATAPPDPLGMAEVLRIPIMRRLWYAQIVSTFGDFLALYAVISIMTFRLHSTPSEITGIQIAYLAPIAVLGIISGVFVDRWPVKPTLVSSDLIRAFLVLGLMFVHTPAGFYVVLASISVLSSFFSPAQGKALRSAVPLHGLRSANALMQQVLMIMRIIGGPVAAFVVAFFGAKTCYLVDTASFFASAALIGSLALVVPGKSPQSSEARVPEARVPEALVPEAPGAAAAALLNHSDETTPAKARSGLSGVFDDMRQGAGFIFHHSGVLFVITALSAAMFALGCFGPLIAVYVRDVIHASTKTFGVTSGMVGIGLLSGINILNSAARRVSHVTLTFAGLAGIAVGTLLMALLPHLWMTIPALLLVGFAAAGVIVPSQTMIQQETPQAMLGRVGSTVMSLIFSAQIAGLILSGILAQFTSVRRVFLFTTVMLAVLLVVGKLWMKPETPAPAAA
jgi:DHA3 family macrolide efflux protein-like MFS transporter